MLVRTALSLVALVVIAWTGVLLRDFTIGDPAAKRSLLAPELPTGQRAADRRALADAQFLDPSSAWALAHALNQIRAGNHAAAARESEALVRDEPENVQAWLVLRAATERTDPARSAQARARVKRLDPLGSD